MGEVRTLSDRKREAILLAAAAEFQENGYPSTTMDRIAERARVSKRTVYNHFSSKDELFKAISVGILERAHRATEYPFNPVESLEHQLLEIGQREAELVTSHDFVKLSRVMLAECIRSPELARDVFAEMQSGESGVARWMREAAAQGRLRVQDPDRAASQFTGLIKTFLFWPQLIASAPSLSKSERQTAVESAVRLILDHYRV